MYSIINQKAFSIEGPTQSTFKWQTKLAKILAVGTKGNLNLFDRQGQLISTNEIPLECKDLKWSPKGFPLAISLKKSSDLIFWDLLGLKK